MINWKDQNRERGIVHLCLQCLCCFISSCGLREGFCVYVCVCVFQFFCYFLMIPLCSHTLSPLVCHLFHQWLTCPLWPMPYSVNKWIFITICSAVLKTEVVPWTFVLLPSYNVTFSYSGPTLSFCLLLFFFFWTDCSLVLNVLLLLFYE